MKNGAGLLTTLLSLFLLANGDQLEDASGDQFEGSPVTKVVRMLKDLEEKLEKEAETEKDLYDKFRCWGTSTVESKTKSVEDAESRIRYLTDYILDISSGKVTFTLNKEELEKEFASAHADTLNTTGERNVTHNEFEITETEEEEAVEGLEKATEIVKQTTAGERTSTDHSTRMSLVAASDAGRTHQSMLLSLRGTQSARARVQKAKKLQKALDLGDQYLSKANSIFLRRIITGRRGKSYDGSVGRLGAVSAVKKADPGKSGMDPYKTRTDVVVKELNKIHDSFVKDLRDIKRVELKDLQAYKKKHELQIQEENVVKDRLKKLAKETAAREQAKMQSQEEIDDLTEQNKVDNDLISKITASMKEKATEWDKRTAFRQGEVSALGEAIQVLTSDEARDAFHSSATNFLQIASAASQRARLATQVLRSAAGVAKDRRLVVLAARVSNVLRNSSQAIVNPTFDAVLEKIDEMKEAIDSEETSDLETKEKCEADLADNTATKIAKERGIEAEESAKGFAQDKISELTARIKKVNNSIAGVKEQMADAKKLRDDENAEFEKAKAEDVQAVQLIELATLKITEFYAAQRQSSLLQQTRSSGGESLLQQPLDDTLRSAGGETPWKEAEYNGAGSQVAGVTEVLKMVSDDVKKDILEGEKAESESEADYQAQKTEMENEMSDMEDARSKLDIKKAGRETDSEDAEKSKADFQGELDAVVELMASLKPKCDFYTQNYEVRARNRLTEIKGLDKAKAILKGSFFEDRDRELKPGDSF